MDAAELRIAEQALDWVRRIHDPSFSDWEEHAAWLEADAHNLSAFDDASLLIEEATARLEPAKARHMHQVATNDNVSMSLTSGSPKRRRWSSGLGVAVAAGLVAVVAIPSIMTVGTRTYVIQTAPGAGRTVTLDGTVIALAGESRLRLDRSDRRIAVLERGEAFFDVKHDAAHPFRVSVGGRTIQDVGTQFDVIRRQGVTELAVREGEILFDPGQADVQLVGGQSLRVSDHVATVQPVDATFVGGWRGGRLAYRDAPLGEVAQDIARSIGEPVTVDGPLLEHRFSGVVMIDADHARMFGRLAAVTGVNIRRAPHGWEMVSPAR